MNDMVSMRKTRPLGLTGISTGAEAGAEVDFSAGVPGRVDEMLGRAGALSAAFDDDVLRGGKLLV